MPAASMMAPGASKVRNEALLEKHVTLSAKVEISLQSLQLPPPEVSIVKTVRNKQIETAHMQYGYTLKEIADRLHIHYTTVSKVLKGCKK
jgi:DNA-binding MarR family transcriptional regulator